MEELEKQNHSLSEALESEFRRSFQLEYGAAYEKVCANPEKHGLDVDPFLAEPESSQPKAS